MGKDEYGGNLRKSKGKTNNIEKHQVYVCGLEITWAQGERERDRGGGKSTGRVGGVGMGGSSEGRNKWEMVERMRPAQPRLTNFAHPACFSHTHTDTHTSPVGACS